jgi:hypothetical protein
MTGASPGMPACVTLAWAGLPPHPCAAKVCLRTRPQPTNPMHELKASRMPSNAITQGSRYGMSPVGTGVRA